MQSSDALDTLKCAIWAFTFKILIFQWIIFNVYIYIYITSLGNYDLMWINLVT